MPAHTFSVCVIGNTLFVLSHSFWRKFLFKQKKDFCASKFLLQIFAYRTVVVVHLADQTWIPKTVYCITRGMVCKIDFTNWNPKIAILRASIVVTYYIKLFRTGTNRHISILMSLLLLSSHRNNNKNLTLYYHTFNIQCKIPKFNQPRTQRIFSL